MRTCFQIIGHPKSGFAINLGWISTAGLAGLAIAGNQIASTVEIPFPSSFFFLVDRGKSSN